MNDKTLVDRLRRTHVTKSTFGGVAAGAFHSKPVNPDGEEAATRIEALEAALRETMSRCTDCGGRGSFVKHDEVTDRDLWESCASCAVGYAALEGTKL